MRSNGTKTAIVSEADGNTAVEQQIADVDGKDGPPERLFRPTRPFTKYVSDDVKHFYPTSEKEGYLYPHIDFMKAHFKCAQNFQSSLSRNAVSLATTWSKPCYVARITSDILLRDCFSLRAEVEIRIIELLTKLVVMGVHVDVSPPYLEPLLMNKKVAGDYHRFKRREPISIPPNTSTRTTISKESNAQWTVRKGEVTVPPNIACHGAVLIAPKIISSQEALQWTFLTAVGPSFLSDRLTLPSSNTCKIEIDFVTMTLFIRLVETTNSRSVEEKIKLTSIEMKKNARQDLLRVEFELLDKGKLKEERLQRDRKEALFWSLSTNHVKSAAEKIDAMSYFDDVNTDGNAAIHLATINNHADIVERLLGKGASINSQNRLLQTALHLAIIDGLFDLAKLLIQYGADTNITNYVRDSFP